MTAKDIEVNRAMHRLCGWTFVAARNVWHRRGLWSHKPNAYTTDPAAAMEVLEKCADKRTVAVNHNKDGEWCVAFVKPAVLGACCIDKAIEADTLPLAICLFASQLSKEDNT